MRSLVGDVGVRSLFWGCGDAIAVLGDVGERSLLGCGSAIAFGVWECDCVVDKYNYSSSANICEISRAA
ncbi:MAG: hypothetical protein HEQ24_06880 [Dolichospermum sp. BR01]|nr:hypothetical protein [Dolichospermum sp. BR01]